MIPGRSCSPHRFRDVRDPDDGRPLVAVCRTCGTILDRRRDVTDAQRVEVARRLLEQTTDGLVDLDRPAIRRLEGDLRRARRQTRQEARP